MYFKLITIFFITIMMFSNCHCKSIMMDKVLNKSKEIVDAELEDKSNEIAPPKHLDGFKIGRDGSINSNFHKEVFLGEDVENFQNGNYKLKEQKKKLIELFNQIDVDKDKFITDGELSKWVLLKTKEHFDEARHGNEERFNNLDLDGDGFLSWNEYLVLFLEEKGFDRKDVTEKLANKIKISISEKLNDEVEDLKNKWTEAATLEDPDHLNVSQFLDFLHPELSRSMLEMMIEDFLHDLDVDGDGILTVHEFMAINTDADVDTINDEWAARRRDEFRESIDLDHDNVATKEEIKKYLDPLSESMAEQEARQLISFGDEDMDGRLSLAELLENSEFYTGSKLYNYAKSIHEEF